MELNVTCLSPFSNRSILPQPLFSCPVSAATTRRSCPVRSCPRPPLRAVPVLSDSVLGRRRAPTSSWSRYPKPCRPGRYTWGRAAVGTARCAQLLCCCPCYGACGDAGFWWYRCWCRCDRSSCCRSGGTGCCCCWRCCCRRCRCSGAVQPRARSSSHWLPSARIPAMWAILRPAATSSVSSASPVRSQICLAAALYV